MFFHSNQHLSTWCQAPALTEEDSQDGCVPAGGQPGGSPCHRVAELTSIGHVGLLQRLVDAVCVVGRQETQQPGTCVTKSTQHGSGGTRQTGDAVVAGYTGMCEGPRRNQEDGIDAYSGQEHASFGTNTQNFLQYWDPSS